MVLVESDVEVDGIILQNVWDRLGIGDDALDGLIIWYLKVYFADQRS